MKSTEASHATLCLKYIISRIHTSKHVLFPALFDYLIIYHPWIADLKLNIRIQMCVLLSSVKKNMLISWCSSSRQTPPRTVISRYIRTVSTGIVFLEALGRLVINTTLFALDESGRQQCLHGYHSNTRSIKWYIYIIKHDRSWSKK